MRIVTGESINIVVHSNNNLTIRSTQIAIESSTRSRVADIFMGFFLTGSALVLEIVDVLAVDKVPRLHPPGLGRHGARLVPIVLLGGPVGDMLHLMMISVAT